MTPTSTATRPAPARRSRPAPPPPRTSSEPAPPPRTRSEPAPPPRTSSEPAPPRTRRAPAPHQPRSRPALARTARSAGAGRAARLRPIAPRRAPLARRVRIARVVLVLALVVVAARLFEVQVLRSSRYEQEAAQELTQPVTVPALRGEITDRDGVVLEASVPTDTVVADDFQVSHPVSEARALAPLLHLRASRLAVLLSERSGYVPLVPHLSVEQAKRISAMAFPGITMLASSIDVTPDGGLASPVIGGVDAAGLGDAGLEAEYNRLLAGRAGHETLLESPIGVQLPGTPVTKRTPAVAGTGLELTLDGPLQYTVEQDLAREVVASHAVGGEAIVMDTATGQILAMADLVSTPKPASAGTATTSTSSSATSAAGSPSASSSTSGTVRIGPGGPVEEAPTNAAVTQLYEPGSVFKIVPFSAALAAGVITPKTTFTVPFERIIDGWVFSDATYHPTEQMTATQILAQSSNIGTSFIAQKLGERRLLAQVKKLGFGEPTGLRFPGASSGLLVTATRWATTDWVSLPIGQVDAVSALQVLDAYNAVANGGVFVAPKLVLGTITPGGVVRPTAPSRTHRVIPAWVDRELVSMYEKVVDYGTGVAAAVPGYLVAGKTGTAQLPSDNGTAGYITGAFDGTFVGFAPANHPVLSAIVVLNRPTPIYGGAVAAPVFSEIMAYALHRYDVPTTPGLDGRPQATAPKTLTALVRQAT